MTPRGIDSKLRKDQVLSITISHYINTVSPVSSSYIARQLPLHLSSATVRNILVELEFEGYLSHPHTSAGRVPTQRGYRYYVDYLMNEISLLEEEKVCIKAEYIEASRELDTLLEKASQTISDITHYTSIVSVDGLNNRLFCKGTSFVVGYPEHQNINKIQSILVALEEKAALLDIINQDLAQKVEIFIGQEMECDDIDSCSLVVSKYKIKRGPSGRIAVLGPTRMNYERVVSALDYFSGLIEELL